MSEHLFSKVRMARVLTGWQVWIDGTGYCLALVQSEKEARKIVSKLQSLGSTLDWGNRMRGFTAAA